VVLAAGGYPLSYESGAPIAGLAEDLEGTKVFHAGTAVASATGLDQVVTAGGRVLCVVALAATVDEAQALAYSRVDTLSWKDMYCRRDIGYRALSR